MKKKLMLSVGVLAIAVVVSLNINLAKSDSNSLAFMNIQALAGETNNSENSDLLNGFNLTTSGTREVEGGRLKNCDEIYTCVPGVSSRCAEGRLIIADFITDEANSWVGQRKCMHY